MKTIWESLELFGESMSVSTALMKYAWDARDARWRENETEERLFQLRMGLERAQNKTDFLRRHYRAL